jgi:hypothetical protein
MLVSATALVVNKAKAGDDAGGKLTQGDGSILRFLALTELLESDLWELGGHQATDFASTSLQLALPELLLAGTRHMLAVF